MFSSSVNSATQRTLELVYQTRVTCLAVTMDSNGSPRAVAVSISEISASPIAESTRAIANEWLQFAADHHCNGNSMALLPPAHMVADRSDRLTNNRHLSTMPIYGLSKKSISFIAIGFIVVLFEFLIMYRQARLKGPVQGLFRASQWLTPDSSFWKRVRVAIMRNPRPRICGREKPEAGARGGQNDNRPGQQVPLSSRNLK